MQFLISKRLKKFLSSNLKRFLVSWRKHPWKQTGEDNSRLGDYRPICLVNGMYHSSIKSSNLKRFLESTSLASLNYSSIALLPKKKQDNSRLGDYEPICLVDGIMKIFSKVLKIRLAMHMKKLITKAQIVHQRKINCRWKLRCSRNSLTQQKIKLK